MNTFLNFLLSRINFWFTDRWNWLSKIVDKGKLWWKDTDIWWQLCWRYCQWENFYLLFFFLFSFLFFSRLGTMKDPTIHSSTCIQISASARDITFNLPQMSTLLSSATAISIYISSILQPLTAYTYTENCDGHPDGNGMNAQIL